MHARATADRLEQSRVASVIICNSILLSFITVAVAIRLLTQRLYIKIRLDDSKSSVILSFVWELQDTLINDMS
jgi:hypothetical protein